MTTSVRKDGGPWLLLLFQLPPGKSSGRVGIWRRLRRLGAVALGGAAYALPDDPENRESFEWLRRDVAALGGEALLFAAQPVDEAVVAALARRRGRGKATSPADGSTSLAPLDPTRFRNRTWVTRPRPGIDRMASAWLIRRFVDPKARFAFAEEPAARGAKTIPFDTYGAELGHQQGLCTFEVLARRFAVDDPAVRALAATVHAVDLHEKPADAAEAAMLERLVAGLRATHADDQELLAAGVALFETLHASHREQRARPPARRRQSKGGKKR